MFFGTRVVNYKICRESFYDIYYSVVVINSNTFYTCLKKLLSKLTDFFKKNCIINKYN